MNKPNDDKLAEDHFNLDNFVANKINQQQLKFYAVPRGFKIGIFFSWEETHRSTNGYSGAIFKKFGNIQEAAVFFKANLPLAQDVSNIQSQNQNSQNQQVANNLPIIEEHSFQKNKQIIDIYCDGSVPFNGMKGAKGGIGIVFGSEEISEVVPNDKYGGEMTNNIAELYALKRVFEIIKEKFQKEKGAFYRIFSDSEYSIKSITIWSQKLEKGKKKIKNFELIMEIFKKYQELKHICQLEHVKGHSVSEGNKRADYLARFSSEKSFTNDNIDQKRKGVEIINNFGVSKKIKI